MTKITLVTDDRHLKETINVNPLTFEDVQTCTDQNQKLFRLKKDQCTGEILCEQICEPICVEKPKEKCKTCQK